jgi:hypothetical protein
MDILQDEMGYVRTKLLGLSLLIIISVWVKQFRSLHSLYRTNSDQVWLSRKPCFSKSKLNKIADIVLSQTYCRYHAVEE